VAAGAVAGVLVAFVGATVTSPVRCVVFTPSQYACGFPGDPIDPACLEANRPT
jgi:hypothetical protein